MRAAAILLLGPLLVLSACAAERATDSASFERRLSDEGQCVKVARERQSLGLGSYRAEYLACMSTRGVQQRAAFTD